MKFTYALFLIIACGVICPSQKPGEKTVKELYAKPNEMPDSPSLKYWFFQNS